MRKTATRHAIFCLIVATCVPLPANARWVSPAPALTDEPGVVTDSYTATAFGELIDPIGGDPQPYQFTGAPFDLSSGFYYNRARWLDPQGGRFLEPDPRRGQPIAPNTLHPYSYASGDPVNRLDPSGEFSISESLAVVTIIGVLASCAGPQTAMQPTRIPRKLTWSEVAPPSKGSWGYDWRILWTVTPRSHLGGYIVQHVEASYDVHPEARSPESFWEAWQVAPNSSIPFARQVGWLSYDDRYFQSDGSTGTATITGTARFYEGLSSLPASFVRRGPACRFAGDLPCSVVDPRLPLDNATDPVDHSLKITWP